MSGPDVWGPHGWKFLHYITLGYPNKPKDKDIMLYRNFFEHFKEVIPCSICRNHFKEHMKLYPLTDDIMASKIAFIEWGINMHNKVNEKNNKKIYSFDEGFQEINKYNKDCNGKTIHKYKTIITDNITAIVNNNDTNSKDTNSKDTTYIIGILVIVFIIIIISLIYLKKNYN